MKYSKAVLPFEKQYWPINPLLCLVLSMEIKASPLIKQEASAQVPTQQQKNTQETLGPLRV